MSQYLVDGVIGTLSYFVLAAVILVVGFVILDLITPGKLHELVFVHHLPNAAVITVAQQVSIGIIVVTAVLTSSDILSEGLLETAVFGALGLVIQVVSWRCWKLSFRDVSVISWKIPNSVPVPSWPPSS